MDDDRYHDDETGEVRSRWRPPSSGEEDLPVVGGEPYDPWSLVPPGSNLPVPDLRGLDEQYPPSGFRRGRFRAFLLVTAVGVGLVLVVLLLRGWSAGDDEPDRSLAQNLRTAGLLIAAPSPATPIGVAGISGPGAGHGQE